ncbi:MAG: WD40 repeat domain-containing protein [Candidatus Poribacteria bacterium]|nr:WD40 repeat domain-containing protein [Candidatus Poribacteria bacterium]
MKERNLVVPAPASTNGEDVTTWALPEGAVARLGRGSAGDVAFSPDGQYFAVASAIGLWLYELPTLSPTTLWDTERGMTKGVSFSPDGSQIVTYTFAENVKIWDVQSGVCIRQIEVPNKHLIRKFIFSEDGQRIVAISHGGDHNIYIWCPHTGRQLNEIKLGSTTEGIYPFQFSSDTSLLAGRIRESDADPESISVWHTETGEQIGCFTEYSGEMEKLCFSPDGKHLAAGSSDGMLHVWDVDNGQKAITYTDYGDAQIFPHYVPEDGLIVAAVSQRKVEIWEVEQEQKIDTFEYRGSNVDLYPYFSETGEQLAVASPSEIQIWTKGSNSDTHTVSTLHGHIPTMDTLVFSEDEKTLAAGFWSDNVLLWDVASRRSYRPHGEKLPGTSKRNVYRTPNGKFISTNRYEVKLNVWEVGENEPIAELIGPKEGLARAQAYASTGHRIASADKNNNIHIWECLGSESWKKHPTVINHSEFTDSLGYSPSGLAFSPDGKRLAGISRSRDWKACLWDVDSGEQIFELPLTPLPSRDGRYGKVHIYTYRGNDTGIAFSPRGDIIAGGKWGEIVLWDATDGKTLMTLPQPEESQRPITLCFSPCGLYLASGAWWQPDLQKVPIRLWEVATGKNIITFWGHTTDVQCFAFSQDNTLLVSGGHDGAIYLWDLAPYL